MRYVRQGSRVLGNTCKRFWKERTWRMAASITFYVLLMLGPLLAIQLRLAGLLVSEDSYYDQVLEVIENAVGDEGADAVENLIDNFSLPKSGWISILLGLWMLVFGGSNAMAQLRDSLREIWGAQDEEYSGKEKSRPAWLQILLDLSFVLIISMVLMTSVLLNSMLMFARSALDDAPPAYFTAIRIIDLVLALMLLSALFAAIYRVLPARRLPWSRVWIGAAVTAGLFSLGRYGVMLWISKANLDSVYGSLTFFIILTTWVYLASQLLLFGGCLTHELDREASGSLG